MEIVLNADQRQEVARKVENAAKVVGLYHMDWEDAVRLCPKEIGVVRFTGCDEMVDNHTRRMESSGGFGLAYVVTLFNQKIHGVVYGDGYRDDDYVVLDWNNKVM